MAADWYQRLGVSPGASTAEIRAAYARHARAMHPDRFGDPQEKKRAEAEFREVTTAFNTLVNPRSRQEYDAQLASPARPQTPAEAAADAYAKALPLLGQAGRSDEAIALLRVAVHHAPREAAYRAALGRVLSALPEHAREAIRQLEQATSLDPRHVAAFADLAELLAAQGLHIRARKALDAGLRAAPGEPRLTRIAADLGSSGLAP